MKVLQIARQFYPSMAGVERYVMDLCCHLMRCGVQSDVLTLNRCFYLPGTLPGQETVAGIHVTRIPYWGRQRIFFAPSVLRSLSGYDLLHVHNLDFFADFLILTRPYHGKPVVVSPHGGFFHTQRLAWFKKVYFQTVTRTLLRRADRVIAASHHDRDLFAPLVPHLRFVEYAVDTDRLAGVDKNVEPGLLLYVGRLASNKRVDNLIRVLAHVRRSDARAHLVLVGCDFEDIAGALGALADEVGVAENVTFAGPLPDAALADWLARAHLFVSASEYEAFGISVLEAMATVTVPVVNTLPAFRSYVRNGGNGFLTDFGQPEQAARTILDALRLDEKELAAIGERARQTAARFAWENVVGELLSLYSEVAP